MISHVIQGQDARLSLLRGAALGERAAGATIGPMGRYALVERSYATPILRDAVGVLRAITLEDPVENVAIRMMCDVAVRTSDAAGDGTATAALFFHALLRDGTAARAAGIDAGALGAALTRGTALAVAALRSAAQSVAEDDSIAKTLASNALGGDVQLGALVAEAVAKAGDGMITAQLAAGTNTSLEILDGVSVPIEPVCRELAPRREAGDAALYSPFVLVYDGELSEFSHTLPVLELAAESGRPLVIFCRDVTGEARNGLVMNRRKNIVDVIAVKPKGDDRDNAAAFEDVAAAISVPVLSRHGETGATLGDEIALETTARLVFSPSALLVDNGDTEPASLSRHRGSVAAQSSSAPSDKTLSRRLSRLQGRSVILHVGGRTETETKERRDRISAALFTLRMARRGGVVPGGGAALLRAADALRPLDDSGVAGASARRCLSAALRAPFLRMLRNAGIEGALVADRLCQSAPGTVFDLVTQSYVDGYADGIVDPVETLVTGLQHAVSAARILLESEAIIHR